MWTTGRNRTSPTVLASSRVDVGTGVCCLSVLGVALVYGDISVCSVLATECMEISPWRGAIPRAKNSEKISRLLHTDVGTNQKNIE